MLAFTGMRVGEATALQWNDIDEAAATIRVRRSIDRHVDTTKTGTKRTAPLLPTLEAIVRDHRRSCDADGLPTEGDAWLFPSRVEHHRGKPMHKKALRKPLLAALEAAGLTERSPLMGFAARSTT
jgi:integrase